MTAAERLKATNDVRTTLVQALGGLALLGGFFTTRTFRLTREEQLTDRYTKAVEQLGSEKLDVRLGGIYAPERLMIGSERDHPTVGTRTLQLVHVRLHNAGLWLCGQWDCTEYGLRSLVM